MVWCRNRIHCDPLQVQFRKSLATGKKLGVPAGNRVQKPPHLACTAEAPVAGKNWSVFTTNLDDARFIANELNGYLVTRECRSTSRT